MATKSSETIRHRFLDVADELQTDSMPIEGYEKKPLVSLEESVQQIKSVVGDLDRKVWLAKRGSANPEDNLSPDESAAIRLYSMQWGTSEENLCTLLNQTLRKEKRALLQPWFSYLKLFLTALFKLPSIKMNLWRGVHGDISNDYQIDTIWWGFSSCTETMEQIDQFLKREGPRTMFMIECLTGKSIRKHSAFPSENEILLMPGSYFKVVGKYSPAKDLHIIQLREEILPYPLLNPPFVIEKPTAETPIVKETQDQSIRLIPPVPKMLKVGLDWLYPQSNDANQKAIRRLHQLEAMIQEPPEKLDELLFYHILGSILGLAIGEAMGLPVENRSHGYLVQNPLLDMMAGGLHGLGKGQFSRCTSMALCLASSLIVHQGLNLYDQLVRYKWWYRFGFFSSTGYCFDLGETTKRSLEEFEERQKKFANKHSISLDEIDYLSDAELLKSFDVFCDKRNSAGSEALVRLAPVPLFFYKDPETAVQYAGRSAQITHGDARCSDACRYLAALIVAAIHGECKEELLNDHFYDDHKVWFGGKRLHPEIFSVARGSYKKKRGYDDGIRGKDFVVQSLEAALWAFWSTNSFEDGLLAAVNLGDNTATTGAIFGQLAGVFYGFNRIPRHWLYEIYARDFLDKISRWISYEGRIWTKKT